MLGIFDAHSHRCNYKAWELDHDGQDLTQQVVISRDQYIEPSSAPDIPLSLFKLVT